MRRLCLFHTLLFTLLLSAHGNLAAARQYQGVLSDPVALGAWLYAGECNRCHSDYQQERLAADYDEEELVAAIAEEGCHISWSREYGGVLRTREIKALAAFMLEWEKIGSAPQLPELPPWPAMETAEPVKVTAQKPPPAKKNEQATLSPVLQQLIDSNTVARGGWLYTINCYRCHLGYEKARMGKGMAKENLQRFITEGKTSTQMQPFSKMLGGNLKNSEILSIVSYIITWEKSGESLAIAPALMTPPAFSPADFIPLRLPRFNQVGGDRIAGAQLFKNNCSSCHGAAGQGGIGPSLQNSRWTMRPDLFFKSTVKRGIPSSPMQAWDRGNGGRFGAKDIDDVVSHLLVLP